MEIVLFGRRTPRRKRGAFIELLYVRVCRGIRILVPIICQRLSSNYCADIASERTRTADPATPAAETLA